MNDYFHIHQTVDSPAFDRAFREADSDRDGVLSGGEVAKFLRDKSKLEVDVLKKIWRTVAQPGSNELNKQEFCLALQLIALAMRGKDPSKEALNVEKLNTISDADRMKYEAEFFDGDTDFDGRIGGEDARRVLSATGVPKNILREVWRLSDLNGESYLDKTEFIICRHLIDRFKEGIPLPLDSIPRELLASALGQDPSAMMGGPMMGFVPPQAQQQWPQAPAQHMSGGSLGGGGGFGGNPPGPGGFADGFGMSAGPVGGGGFSDGFSDGFGGGGPGGSGGDAAGFPQQSPPQAPKQPKKKSNKAAAAASADFGDFGDGFGDGFGGGGGGGAPVSAPGIGGGFMDDFGGGMTGAGAQSSSAPSSQHNSSKNRQSRSASQLGSEQEGAFGDFGFSPAPAAAPGKSSGGGTLGNLASDFMSGNVDISMDIPESTQSRPQQPVPAPQGAGGFGGVTGPVDQQFPMSAPSPPASFYKGTSAGPARPVPNSGGLSTSMGGGGGDIPMQTLQELNQDMGSLSREMADGQKREDRSSRLNERMELLGDTHRKLVELLQGLKSRKEELSSKLLESSSEIDDLSEKVTVLEKQVDDERETLLEVEIKYGQVDLRVEELRRRKKEAEGMLQRLKMSIEERKHLHSLQESAISSLEGEVKELELQSSHALDAVLSADSSSVDVAKRQQALRSSVLILKQNIQTLEEQARGATSEKGSIEKEIASLSATAASLKDQEAKLRDEARAAQNAIVKLRSDATRQQATLEADKEKQERVQSLLSTLNAATQELSDLLGGLPAEEMPAGASNSNPSGPAPPAQASMPAAATAASDASGWGEDAWPSSSEGNSTPTTSSSVPGAAPVAAIAAEEDPWDDEDGAWVTSPAVAPAPVAAPSNGEKTTNPSAEAAGWGEDEGDEEWDIEVSSRPRPGANAVASAGGAGAAPAPASDAQAAESDPVEEGWADEW